MEQCTGGAPSETVENMPEDQPLSPDQLSTPGRDSGLSSFCVSPMTDPGTDPFPSPLYALPRVQRGPRRSRTVSQSSTVSVSDSELEDEVFPNPLKKSGIESKLHSLRLEQELNICQGDLKSTKKSLRRAEDEIKYLQQKLHEKEGECSERKEREGNLNSMYGQLKEYMADEIKRSKDSEDKCKHDLHRQETKHKKVVQIFQKSHFDCLKENKRTIDSCAKKLTHSRVQYFQLKHLTTSNIY